MNKWNYYDMFSGIAGFHYGLKMAGFEFEKVYYSDIDEYANKVYNLRFPKAIPLGDITRVNASDLGKIDIVTAGFPCQNLSVAGKQEGIHGDRSGLFDEIIRVCRVCRPKYIILENVANLISRPEWIGYVLGRLSEIWYDAEWQIISAADIGAPHLRKRIWIIAYPQGFSCKQRIQDPERQQKIQAKRLIGNRWNIKSNICGGNNGIPNRVDRLKCLGNSIVPQIACYIGKCILQREKKKA